jgi:hypothetical protein
MLEKRTAGAPLSEAEIQQRRDAARARWAAAGVGALAGAGAAALVAHEVADRTFKRRVLDAAQRRAVDAQTAVDRARTQVRGWANLLQNDFAEREKWIRGSGAPVRGAVANELNRERTRRAMPGMGLQERPLSAAARRVQRFGHLPTIGTVNNNQVLKLIEQRLARRVQSIKSMRADLYVDPAADFPEFKDAQGGHRQERALNVYLKEAENELQAFRNRKTPGAALVAPGKRKAKGNAGIELDAPKARGAPAESDVRAHTKSVFRGGWTKKQIATAIAVERKAIAAKTARAIGRIERVARARTVRAEAAARAKLRQDVGRLSAWALSRARRLRNRTALVGALVGAGVGALAVKRKDLQESLGKSAPLAKADLEGALAEALLRMFQRWRSARETAAATPAQAADDIDRSTEVLDDLFSGGAGEAIGQLDPSGGPDRERRLAVSFDLRNPLVERELRRYRLDLVREISGEQTQAIRTILLRGTAEGRPTQDMARDIRETVGLTAWQAEQVQRYRRQLETLDPSALRRELRDRRFDRTFQAAIDRNQNLTPERVDRMVDGYYRRFLAFRATTISRTEALRATNLGNVAAARAWLTENPSMTLVKTWVATRDARTRDLHVELNGRSVVGIDTPFVCSDGSTIRHPHDPEAAAKHTVNCRCTISWAPVAKARAVERAVQEASS